jgi:hypothetical protein
LVVQKEQSNHLQFAPGEAVRSPVVSSSLFLSG